MRHYYFRLVLGIVWLVAAIISALTASFPFMALYIALGIAFLYSAFSIREAEKGKRR